MSKTKLKDIASFSKGQQINGDQLLVDGIYEYLNGGINPSGKWSSFNVCGDTIAISEGGNSCGYVNYMAHDFWCGGHCYYLYDVKCLTKYLYYALKSQQDRIMKLRSGACMPNIKKKDLGDFVFEYNDNPVEQEKAIKIFDLFESVISYKTQHIKKLDELVKSRFVEMFGDPIANTSDYNTAKLRNLSIKICDGVHAKPEYTDTGRPFLSVVNINRRTIDFSNCKYVSEEAYQKMIKSTHPEKGDILYTKVGATYGIPAYVDTDIEFCLYVSVCLIKPKHELINSKFLAIQMDMPFVKYQADKRIKGIGVPDLHLNQISEFEIILPPRELQNQFADFVTQVEKQKATVQQSIEKLETLKKSLMQEYFG